jgi:clan AA aspartic protease
MGLTYTTIELRNPKRPDLAPVRIDALVDTGATYLCIPHHVRNALELDELEQRDTTFADGRDRSGPYVGPVQVGWQDRGCFVGAMVFGDEALLGAIPMEDMNLLVNPLTREVFVNPKPIRV